MPPALNFAQICGVALAMLFLQLNSWGALPAQLASQSTRDSSSVGPEAALTRLQDRERLFGDSIVKYKKTRSLRLRLESLAAREIGNMKTDPNYQTDLSLSDLLVDVPSPISVQYVSDESLMSSAGITAIENMGEAFTVAGGADWEAKKSIFLPLIKGGPPQRCSDSEKLLRSMVPDEDPPFVNLFSNPNSKLGYRRQRLYLRLAMGVCPCRQILSVKSTSQEDDGLVIEGEINAWDNDVSKFRFVLDEDSVIIKAEIRNTGQTTWNLISTTCEGRLKHSGRIPLPSTGQFSVATGPIAPNSSEIRIKQEVAIELTGISTPVPPSQYARLTQFPDTENTIVFDLTTGAEAGTTEAGARVASRVVFLILLNVLFAIFLIWQSERYHAHHNPHQPKQI